MNIELPSEFYQPGTHPPRQRLALQLLLAGLSAAFCTWQLLGLPGAQLKRYDPPADMPWSGRGLSQVYIDKNGDWTINRVGYADRMRRYEIDASGYLERFTAVNLDATQTDISGVMHGGTPMLSWGAKLRVRGSSAYNEWAKRMRSDQRPAAKIGLSGKPPPYVALADQMMQSEISSVPVEIYPPEAQSADERVRTVQILYGYHYFPVFDSWALSEPHMWLTTDRLRYLHKFKLTPNDRDVDLTLERSVPLNADIKAERSVVLGRDPISARLFILLVTGERFWFDADTLAPLDRDKLPGDWDFEYGELGYSGPGYNYYLGWPLSEAGFKRLQGALMVVLLASLLALIVLWRRAWKSTAAATTAATNSSSSSSTT